MSAHEAAKERPECACKPGVGFPTLVWDAACPVHGEGTGWYERVQARVKALTEARRTEGDAVPQSRSDGWDQRHLTPIDHERLNALIDAPNPRFLPTEGDAP